VNAGRFVTALLIALLALVGVGTAAATTSSATTSTVEIAGHRGAPRVHTENTRAGFKYALDHGVDYIEMDVRINASGSDVIMHDPTVDRTTDGTGQVTSFTYREWTALRTPDGLPVPFLGNTMALLATYPNAKALVEIKPTGLTDAQYMSIANAITNAGAGDQVVVNSFDAHNINRFRYLTGHTIRTAFITATADLSTSWPNGLHPGIDVQPRYDILTSDLVAAWHAQGREVYAWTPDTPTTWSSTAALGVDVLITNDFEGAMAWRATT
jgi:glycerophosphoryl diester phosphodiesterase